MRTVHYHRYWVTAPGRKREYLTGFHMSAEEAAKHYPAGARPEPSSLEVREEPETEEERMQMMYMVQSAGHDSVKPPK